jgi:hypothetical protein
MPSNDRGRYKRILCFTSKLAALDKINNCTKAKKYNRQHCFISKDLSELLLYDE